MRTRPFFWLLLVLSCVSVLVFAITRPTETPAIMQVSQEQVAPTTSGITTLTLHLTDPQGLPLEQVQVKPQANMTNMAMETKEISVDEVGQGQYVVHCHLYMSGPWAITITTHVDGFAPLHKTIFVQIE